ncbi:transposase [Oceanidesulfovibrio indonesiensis]|uniref:Transposase n=1 Tax=Oceanidesulfovibrio indonesiensis TaxID=54767 RepID=A0A7M3MJA4_9BACT|nr:transposase [Oceanidesulfovibrio indonesiensis]TVM19411.1 transposase [Oceanidesulfovibrio indonesiensis]
MPDTTSSNAIDFRRIIERSCREHGTGCPRCECSRVYSLKDGRNRCRDCGYTFHALSRRWINRGHMPLESWAVLLRCFEDGLNVNQAARVLGVKYDTAHRAYGTIRSAILADMCGFDDLFDKRGELMGFCPNLDREELQTLCDGCRSYVFQLASTGGRILLSLMPGAKARDVLAWPLPKKQWRCFIHTDTYQGRDALVFACCKKGRDLFSRHFTEELLHLDRVNDLKSFVDGWLAQFRAIKPEAYPLYLAEALLRYNMRGRPMTSYLVSCLCRVVPERGA